MNKLHCSCLRTVYCSHFYWVSQSLTACYTVLAKFSQCSPVCLCNQTEGCNKLKRF